VNESAFIERLRALATHPGARGLNDDAAVIEVGGQGLVLTHDMLVEGVHFLPGDPPETVAWKLVAVNLSDLAAKGARPSGVLLGFALAGNDAWDRAFANGLGAALSHFETALLGGDTVAMPVGAPRALGLTALGLAPEGGAPSRAGAQPGDALYVSGTIGDAGVGLALLQAGQTEPAALIDAYRRPMPSLALGQALAPLVSAMADVSDGLLIDAQRIARASVCGIEVALDAVPLSPAFVAARGDTQESRLFAATSGDDYRLLFSIHPARIAQLPDLGIPLTRIGTCTANEGLHLSYNGAPLPPPPHLGYEHTSSPA
jgi:thiamine-monophosphate kinase